MKELISTIVSDMSNIRKAQARFLATLFPTILATRGAVNFRNLARYSGFNEKTYRRGFARSFDFVDFNRRLIDATFCKHSARISVFDASFIKKAGQHTHGLGFFYNGCHHRPERGLEISSFAICDMACHTALTLSVQQSPSLAGKKSALDEQTMIDHYIGHIRAVRVYLHASETILVVDGYFAKQKVFDALDEEDLSQITRLRKDADMRYLYEGPKRASGSGRQKVYDGKVNWQDLSRFENAGLYNGYQVYTKLLNHKRFKRNLRVVVLVNPDKPDDYILLCATLTNLEALTVCRYYSARYQIEFLYRDGKQYTGLEDCQARDEKRLAFHFNASLTTLNLAKAEQIKQHDSAQPFVFSMASVKARYFNEQYLDLFFCKLGLDPELIKKSPHYKWLCDYGAIAA